MVFEHPTPAALARLLTNATVGEPVARNLNGGRVFFLRRAAECQLPARTAAMISARFCASARDASSNATSDLAAQI